MRVPELLEETQDLDWFALDQEGVIGHFTTGGCGALPRSVVSSLEDLRRATGFFRNQLVPTALPIVSPKIDSHVSLKDERAKARYLQDFIKMASRGLFSFDYLRTGTRPTGYFQVATPSVPLHITSLPPEIRQILDKTVLNGIFFHKVNEIDVGAIG